MNQYRCETCKHFKTRRKVPVKQYVDGDVGECQHPILKKNNYGIEWLRFVINRDLGCASHSDFNPQAAPDLSHITPERRGCLTCLAPDCPVWQAADQNCWKPMPTNPQAEREKVLNELDKRCDDWISQIKEIDIDGYSDPTAIEKIDLLHYIKGELKELREGKGE